MSDVGLWNGLVAEGTHDGVRGPPGAVGASEAGVGLRGIICTCYQLHERKELKQATRERERRERSSNLTSGAIEGLGTLQRLGGLSRAEVARRTPGGVGRSRYRHI